MGRSGGEREGEGGGFSAAKIDGWMDGWRKRKKKKKNNKKKDDKNKTQKKNV